MNCESPVFFINPTFKRWASGVHTYIVDGEAHGVDFPFTYRQFRAHFLNMRKRVLVIDDVNGEHFEYDKDYDKWLSENVLACIEDRRVVPVFLYVPCGHCSACRVHRHSELQSRLALEALSHPGRSSIFITLTYNDHYNPPMGVCQDHVQGFLKRLRQNIVNSGYDAYFRPFYASEYGSPKYTQRPHYHIMLFGVDLSAPGAIINFNNQMKKSWKFGNAPWEVAHNVLAAGRYCAKYVIKSVDDGSNVPEGKNPNFWRGPSSSEGGLGSLMLDYILTDAKFDYCKDTHVLFKCPDAPSGHVKIRIPQFILDKIEPPTSRIVTKAIFDMYGEALDHYAVISKLHDAIGDVEQIPDLQEVDIIEKFAPSNYYDDNRTVPSHILTDDDVDLLESVNTFGSVSGGTTRKIAK